MAKLALAFDILAKDKASREFRQVGDAAEDTGRRGERLKKGLAIGAAAIAAGGVAAAAAGVKLFNHGAALEAMGNKANTVFGDQIGVVEKWAKANAAGMGLSSREATGLAASFGDLLIPMGFTRDQAAKMSTDVVGLSGALSQWSGGQVSAADASDILAKAMLGERDGLKSLGISISEADVQQRLLEKGQNKLTGAALEQAKAVATQELIFEKSTDAQAAYEAGGNKLLTAQNNLKAKLKEVFDEVSVRLIPVFARLSTWVVEQGIPSAERLYAQFKTNVLPILKDVGAFVKDPLIPTLQDFGSWINRNKDFLIPFAATVAAVVAGFKIYATVQKGVTAVTAAWNAVLLMNPIGLVIIAVAALVAGLVVAYQRSETFRDIVNGAFDAVKRAASALAEAAVGSFQFLLDMWLGTAEWIVKGAAQAFGWVPGLGDKLKGASRAVEGFRDDANRALNSVKNVITVGADTSHAKRGIDEIISYIGRANSTLTVNVRQQDRGPRGDGPGAVGGSTLERVMPLLNRYGGYVTSTYRTPEENRRVGGSPRSYHLDRANPAVDIGGSTGVLNNVASRLRGMGGWRELLWQVPGHFDHIHVAHAGGTVSSSWPTMPGWRADERPVRAQVGEEIIARGGLDEANALLAAILGAIQRLPREHQQALRQMAV
jgi:hypothetical protein